MWWEFDEEHISNIFLWDHRVMRYNVSYIMLWVVIKWMLCRADRLLICLADVRCIYMDVMIPISTDDQSPIIKSLSRLSRPCHLCKMCLSNKQFAVGFRNQFIVCWTRILYRLSSLKVQYCPSCINIFTHL